MVRKKRESSETKQNIIAGLIQEYDIKSAKDIELALKDLLGDTLEKMLESELTEHLGHDKYERNSGANFRNGHRSKKVVSSYGEMEINVPQDRESSFDPQVVKKRQKDISGIEQKVISMYARGMTTRQISAQIADIYGFTPSEGMISDIADPSAPGDRRMAGTPVSEHLSYSIYRRSSLFRT